MNNVASVKDRLKNKSITTGKSVQELLNYTPLASNRSRQPIYLQHLKAKHRSTIRLFNKP